MRPPWPVASLAALYAYVSPALAIKAGSFAGAGNTQVSAMMVRRFVLRFWFFIHRSLDVRWERAKSLHHG